MNYLSKLLPVLFRGLFLLFPLVVSAQAPTYSLSWYKTSCSTAAGTPTELRVDIEPFAAGTTYVCELHNDPNPSGGQSSNPLLGAVTLKGTYTTSNVNVIIDAFFANAEYKKSYYVKVYPQTALSQSRVQYIDVQRLIPSAGSYVTNVNYNVSTTPEFCNSSAVNMDILLTTTGTTVGHLYTWTSSTGATIATPNSQNPTVPIYINGNSGPKHQYQVQINDVAGCAKVISNIEYNPPQPFTGLSVAIKPFGFFSPECGDIAAEVLNAPTNGSYIYEWYNSNGSLYQTSLRPSIEGLKPSSSYFVRLKTPAGCLLQTLPSFQTPDAISCTIGTITGDPCVCLLYTSPSPRDRG